MLLSGNLKTMVASASVVMSALQRSSQLWSRNLLPLVNQIYTSSHHRSFNSKHGILKNPRQCLSINCRHRTPSTSSQYQTFSTCQQSINLPSSTHTNVELHSSTGLLSVGSLSGGSVNFIPRRTFFSKFLKKFKKKSVAVTQKQDQVSSEYKLVYSSPQTSTYLKLGLGGVEVVAASLVSVTACVMSGVQLANLHYLYQNPVEAAVFVVVNVVFCLGILKVIAAHPMRIYYSEEEDLFIAVFLGIHPFTVRQKKIKPGEVRRLPPSKVWETIIPWQTNNYTTSSSQRIYLDVIHFQYPVYYNKLLGYENKTS